MDYDEMKEFLEKNCSDLVFYFDAHGAGEFCRGTYTNKSSKLHLQMDGLVTECFSIIEAITSW